MGAISLITMIPYSSYVAAFSFVQTEWSLSATQASILFSAYLFGSALSALLLVPQMGRRPTPGMMFSGLLVSSVCHLLFPFIGRGFWSAATLRLAGGAGQIVTYMAGIQLVSQRYADTDRGSAIGVYVGLGYAGTTLSYVLSGLLLDRLGAWRPAYLATALIGATSILLAFCLLWSDIRRSGKPPSNPTQYSVRLDPIVLHNFPLLLVIAVYALHAAELYLARLWLPLLLRVNFMENGIPPAAATARGVTMAGFMFIPGAMSVFFGGWLSDRLGRPLAAALIFGISGLCSFLLGWLVIFPSSLVIAIGFMYGLMTAADSAIYSTSVTELAPAGQLGSAQAVQALSGYFAGAVVPVVAGGILDANPSLASWGYAFSFSGCLAVIALVMLRRLSLHPQLSTKAPTL